MSRKFFLFLCVIGIWLLPSLSQALKPDEILVIANSRVSDSVRIARYYMKKRNIPASNLIKVKISQKERCPREEYRRLILAPLKRFLVLADDDEKFRCIVTVYGVPLLIVPDRLDEEREKQLVAKRLLLEMLKHKLEMAKNEGKEKEVIDALKKDIDKVRDEVRKLGETEQAASVDSELSLARFDKYRLEMWLPNPYFVGYQKNKGKLVPLKKRVFMVSRLDGPDYKTVKRIIDDSIAVENRGLTGIAYFDARYPNVGKSASMYGKYDLSIREAAKIVDESHLMKKVVLDVRPKLFEPDTCPNAALYCGWYSLANYIDAFSWVRGAVGYHIASAECVSLHDKNATYWCLKMLEKGVAATLGPVAEPYLRAFPPPDLFFRFLLEDKPLVEAYFLSKPFVSWRMVLIGDPLYRPFKKVMGEK